MRPIIGRRFSSFARRVAGLLPVALVASCSSLSQPISLGSLPPSDTISSANPPTAAYSDIAQHALTCWVGLKGPLRETHIFHAEAASPTTGGAAEINIQERDRTAQHPWGARAFRIELTSEAGSGTRIAMNNIKLPADLAEAMRADVVDWVKGGDGCQAQVVRPPPPDPPAPAKTTVKLRRTN